MSQSKQKPQPVLGTTDVTGSLNFSVPVGGQTSLSVNAHGVPVKKLERFIQLEQAFEAHKTQLQASGGHAQQALPPWVQKLPWDLMISIGVQALEAWLAAMGIPVPPAP